jgi:hypothetical protein
MKTNELTGAALDWAVCKASGTVDIDMVWELVKRAGISYSTDWEYGGRVIERERICLIDQGGDYWQAITGWTEVFGDTPLEAAMRCYVASKLGDEVQIPEEVVR